MFSARTLALAVAWLFVFQSPVLAWDDLGHQTIVQLALKKLTPETKQKIIAVLGPDESLESTVLWPDDMKRSEQWSFTYRYHFAEGGPDTDIRGALSRSAADPVRALYGYEHVLANAQSEIEQRKIALRFVAHLIGDIHQPLHAGYTSDFGGTRLKVSFLGKTVSRGRPMNLHVVWDHYLSSKDREQNCGPFDSYAACIDDGLGPDAAGDPLSWLENSRTHLKEVYAFSGASLDEEYALKKAKLARGFLNQAARRLAYRLERDFSGKAQVYEPAYEALLKTLFGQHLAIRLF